MQEDHELVLGDHKGARTIYKRVGHVTFLLLLMLCLSCCKAPDLVLTFAAMTQVTHTNADPICEELPLCRMTESKMKGRS